MKKAFLALMVSAVTCSAALAADYPEACAKLEDLTAEMAELNPEMAATLEQGGTEEERKELARKGFAAMSAEQQEQAAKDCQMAVEQLEQLVEMMKAS